MEKINLAQESIHSQSQTCFENSKPRKQILANSYSSQDQSESMIWEQDQNFHSLEERKDYLQIHQPLLHLKKASNVQFEIECCLWNWKPWKRKKNSRSSGFVKLSFVWKQRNNRKMLWNIWKMLWYHVKWKDSWRNWKNLIDYWERMISKSVTNN